MTDDRYTRDEMELHSLDAAAEPEWGVQQPGPHVLSTHPERVCAGRGIPCVIHSPSDHHMRDWKLNWRGDRGLMERICPHGIGHPDPDDLAYKVSIGLDHEGVHSCDGCCAP